MPQGHLLAHPVEDHRPPVNRINPASRSLLQIVFFDTTTFNFSCTT
jgi:hypothetical protein